MQLLPRTLFGRTLLLICAALLVLAISYGLALRGMLLNTVSLRLAELTALRLESDGAGAVLQDSGPPTNASPDAFPHLWAPYVAALRARLGPQATVALDPGNDELWIRAPSTAGRWARLPVELPLRQILIRTTLAAALGLLVTMALAMWLARRTTRPLRNLAQWAEGDGTGDVPQTSAAQAGIEAAQLSAALARLQSRLDAASREREVVLAGISHDLRTPLTRLRLRLAMEQLAPATMLEIDREIDELDSIVEQFVAYARGVDAEPQLRTALDPLVRAAAPADGTVLLDLRSSRRVHVRAGAIARIVTNLLDNARRHGRTPIELRTYDDGDGVMLAVRDHGPGISPEDAARAQAPFVRLHNDRTRVGTGLGLAIVARLAAADGGRVHLHQVAGEYFEVQLRWPA